MEDSPTLGRMDKAESGEERVPSSPPLPGKGPQDPQPFPVEQRPLWCVFRGPWFVFIGMCLSLSLHVLVPG